MIIVIGSIFVLFGIYCVLDTLFNINEIFKQIFYKKHIRYTTDQYSFYKFPKDKDPFWYFKEIVRSDGYVIQRTQIGKEEYIQGKREQKLERIYYGNKDNNKK